MITVSLMLTQFVALAGAHEWRDLSENDMVSSIYERRQNRGDKRGISTKVFLHKSLLLFVFIANICTAAAEYKTDIVRSSKTKIILKSFKN